jgi:hypothetical protein
MLLDLYFLLEDQAPATIEPVVDCESLVALDAASGTEASDETGAIETTLVGSEETTITTLDECFNTCCEDT